MHLIKKIKRFWGEKVLRHLYERTGKCLGCGMCCTHIYVRHSKDIIKTEEEFEKLRYIHPFYSYLEVIDKDETGLIFKCSKRDEETKLCTIHSKRPCICRKYPQEEIFLMGGTLAEGCGYKFTPYRSFDEVLNKLISNNNKGKKIR